MSIKKLVINPFREFFKHEASSGIILLVCTIAALLVANSPFVHAYNSFLHNYLSVGVGDFKIKLSILHWINDGLMAVFFFVIGLEIKRELTVGELRSARKALLPIAAAIAGMLVPALIFLFFNYNKPTISGWSIPMATDIAFALGILSLMGRQKAPKAIAVFLTALAIVDDLGAILIIAVFYTSKISWTAILFSIIVVIILICINKMKIKFIYLYVILGIVLWVCLLKSGIHATIAGVVLGLTIPSGSNDNEQRNSMLHTLEHLLAPWSAYVIMPIFALANAGVTIDFRNFSAFLFSPLNLGIFLGLFLGKQIGVFGISFLLIRMKLSKLPTKITLKHLYGASLLSGIGFTMALFIAALSLPEGNLLSNAKTSIIAASVFSAISGTLVFSTIKPDHI